MEPTDERAAARVDRWRRSLLDLTLRNRLLDAKDGRQSIAIVGADPAALAGRLDDGAALTVGETGVDLPCALPPAELDKSLVAMARSARVSMQEGGAQTLWLALGLLRWREDGVETARHAPILLWPVALKRGSVGERYRVVPTGDDPRRNETLLEKLRVDLGLTVTLPDDDDEATAADHVTATLAAMAAAIAGRAGWEVIPAARLGVFSFTRFGMWLDLASLQMHRSEVCRHLATGAGEAFPDQGSFPDPAKLDDELAPAETFCPLDADASQLVAVRAAEAGKSFVLQGPPGTGKSQTITNLIAQCLARGQTVLFVSEKMAALEVVQRRLAAAGLGDFCLELHSHKARKKLVLDELGRVLDRSWRPGGGASLGGDDARLLASRRALDQYVAALHTPTPLGLDVHDALGRLVALRDAPPLAAAVAAPGAADDTTWLTTRKDALAAHAQAWQVASEAAVEGVHPWRDSTLSAWQLSTADAVTAVLGELDAALGELERVLGEVARAIPGLRPSRRGDLEALGALAAVAMQTARPGAELVTAGRPEGVKKTDLVRAVPKRVDPADIPREPHAWVAMARRRRELAVALDSVWRDDLLKPSGISDDELDALAARFRRWAPRFVLWRWLALRKARARLRPLLDGARPGDARVADDLDAAIAVRRCARLLDEAETPARRWLGALGPGAGGDQTKVDLDAVAGALAWADELRRVFEGVAGAIDPAGKDAAWRAVVAAVSAPGPATAPSVELSWSACREAIERWRLAVERLGTAAAIAVPADEPIAWLRARLPGWRAAVPALRDRAAHVRARKAADELGLGPAVDACERGAASPDRIVEAWERAVLLAWTDARIAEHDALRDFSGAAHHARIAEFAELDRASLAIARARGVMKLSERVPRIATGLDAPAGGIDADSEVGILVHEVKKQRRHKPLRTLFAAIPELIGRLKPCLLMSPLSVAQYLDPALPPFDVVVFDEASQLPTAEAIGALARGKAAVIVGDSRQLPPTRFFEGDPGARAPEGQDPDEYEELESVLDECVAARLPELRLRWHYRSRHEDLIAFSNRRYYADTLSVFPAAAARVPELGVAWRKIAGVYDRGGTRQNRREAEAVVAEIVARCNDPLRAGKSIGVVTFSRPQQALIEDLLDDARRAHPAVEAACSEAAAEPLLVKNLETIQGDERDVILFSVGYGPDAQGGMTMNFGPLGLPGGERRLNVAVTRAREQLVVFSSFEASAIKSANGPDRAPMGVQHLGELLAYVAAGGGAATAEDGVMASPIVAAVAAALEARGWKVRPQVGCAGYRLDLAVLEPEDPGRYVLAIECDGDAYASAPVARDRDRLRALVLGNLGWRLHRIWALDWWHDPEKEAQRAHSAVIAAIAASRAARTPRAQRPTKPTSPPRAAAPAPVPTDVTEKNPAPPPPPRPAPAAKRPDPQGKLFEATASLPPMGTYKAASVPTGRRKPDDLLEPKYEPELGKLIDQILEIEAPIHIDLLSRRVGAYFGIGRLNPKLTDRVRTIASSRAVVGDAGDADAVWRKDQDPGALPAVRAADQGVETRRDAHEIPLGEVAAAAAVVLARNVGLAVDDLSRETAKLLGFGRLGDKVSQRMRAGIDLLAARGGCVIQASGAGVRASLP